MVPVNKSKKLCLFPLFGSHFKPDIIAVFHRSVLQKRAVEDVEMR